MEARRLLNSMLSWKRRPIVRYLSVSMTGLLTSSVIAFAANVFAGRLLGPDEFGKYALMLAVAQIMVIVMLPGIDTAVMRYVVKSRGESNLMSTYISSALMIYLATAGVGLLAIYFVRPVAVKVVPAVAGVYMAALAYAFVISQRNFHDAIVRGLHMFSYQAAVKVMEAVITLGLLVYLLTAAGCSSYECYAASAGGGALASVVLYWPRTVGRMMSSFNTEKALRVWHYGKYGVIGAVAGILQTSADRILIAEELGVYELGLYTAYYASSVMIAIQVGTVLANVIFPVAAARRDHLGMIRQLDKYFLGGLAPSILLIMVGMRFALYLFGSDYPFRWGLSVLMALYAVTSVAVVVYANVISSFSRRTFRFSAGQMMIAGIIYIIALAIMLPRFGVYSPPVAALASFSYMALARLWIMGKGDLFLPEDNVV